ncbi:hypothetical protein AMK68_00665 [candidate division KD3-62 bacterium DG_56]|uniref:Uncharacterized protein n=1 Tax=candidate division KD3-62 bacterium DG_56 TaxID=1704032 RepID=A0A0S7XQQ4_9BACT|nr:MAG: hypothetical protein AMK68_00665 [candidate division KD3-62 bacterium DG_56]
MRIDDSESTRVEIKWSQSQVHTGKALERYLRQLRKKTRGRVEIDRTAKVLPKRAKPDKHLSGFAWDSGQRGRGVIWRCRRCGRTVIAQVMGHPGEDVEALARDVLATLEDHPIDGMITWAAYGFICQVPEAFRLESQRLMAAYIELNFAERKRRIRVVRWGMASVQLARLSLKEWVEGQFGSRRDVWLRTAASQVRGHEGVVLTGHVRRRLHSTRRFFERLVRWRRPIEFAGQVWHCPESERIFGVDSIDREGQAAAVAAQVAASIPCHGD